MDTNLNTQFSFQSVGFCSFRIITDINNSNVAPFAVVSPQAINCTVQFGTFRICSKTLPLQILWLADKIWLQQNNIFLLESNFHIV